MNQAVPAQDDIRARQRIARDVGNEKRPTSPPATRRRLVRDQRRHDVDAGVVEVELDAADPAGIAAGRIEQRARAEPLQQGRKAPPGSRRSPGPPSRGPRRMWPRPTGWSRSIRSNRAARSRPSKFSRSATKRSWASTGGRLVIIGRDSRQIPSASTLYSRSVASEIASRFPHAGFCHSMMWK